MFLCDPPELESCALATQASRFVLVNASDLGASAIQTPVVEKELHPRRDQSPTIALGPIVERGGSAAC